MKQIRTMIRLLAMLALLGWATKILAGKYPIFTAFFGFDPSKADRKLAQNAVTANLSVTARRFQKNSAAETQARQALLGEKGTSFLLILEWLSTKRDFEWVKKLFHFKVTLAKMRGFEANESASGYPT